MIWRKVRKYIVGFNPWMLLLWIDPVLALCCVGILLPFGGWWMNLFCVLLLFLRHLQQTWRRIEDD